MRLLKHPPTHLHRAPGSFGPRLLISAGILSHGLHPRTNVTRSRAASCGELRAVGRWRMFIFLFLRPERFNLSDGGRLGGFSSGHLVSRLKDVYKVPGYSLSYISVRWAAGRVFPGNLKTVVFLHFEHLYRDHTYDQQKSCADCHGLP